MSQLFQSAFFMIRKNWALCENLDDLIVNLLGKDLQHQGITDYLNFNPNVRYTSPSSVQDIIDSLSFVIENDILSSLRNADCYSLMADESTDEGNRNQFAVVVKYLRKTTVEDVYLGVIRLEKATAENLMNNLEQFLLAKQIPIEKAVLVGFDGCNTMSGQNKGKLLMGIQEM